MPPPPGPAGPGFRRVWVRAAPEARGPARVYFGQDGRSVFVEAGGQIDAYEARTGAPGPSFRFPNVTPVVSNVWALDRDRVAAAGFPVKLLTVWDAKTGALLPDLLRENPLPAPTGGAAAASVERQVSTDGRYAFAGYQGVFRAGSYSQTPFRVVETATGRVVHGGEWQNGAARFTGDGSRLLIAETSGRVRWVKLPGGEVEAEWAFQPSPHTRPITGLSADGSLFAYFGGPPGLPFGHYLIDGRTGQVLRSVTNGFTLDRTALSADGRLLVGIVSDPQNARSTAAVVSDSRTGVVLARTPIPDGFHPLSFAPDGRSFVIYHPQNKDVTVFELRGDLPPVPDAASVPAPATVPPRRTGPVAQDGGQVPPPAPMAGVADKPGDQVAQSGRPAPPPARPPGREPDAEPPRAVEQPGDLKPRWVARPGIGGTRANVVYTPGARLVLLSNPGTKENAAVDALTGKLAPVRIAGLGEVAGGALFPMTGDRVGILHQDAPEVAVWDAKTDTAGPPVRLPDIPAGPAQHNYRYARLSPDGKFLAVARYGIGVPRPATPFRLFDTTIGKPVLEFDWVAGSVHFTADSSRVLVAENNGRCRWFKLPSGQPDGEWPAAASQTSEVTGVSADGGVVGCWGWRAAGGACLLDGRTGKVLRAFGAEYSFSSPVSVSADGKRAAVMRMWPPGGTEFVIDVLSSGDGTRVGRVRVATAQRMIPLFALTPDGKALLVHDSFGQALYWFDLPDREARRRLGKSCQATVRPEPPRNDRQGAHGRFTLSTRRANRYQ